MMCPCCSYDTRRKPMKQDTIKSDALLVLTAAIWGLAFVAQRVGMDHLGPFTFNAIRFFLGCLSLLPFMIRRRPGGYALKGLIPAGVVCGVFLFAGASLQQAGIVYTTAGKAGFITGLYVVLVPFLNMCFRQERASAGSWIGALLATAGMYLLSVTEELHMTFGDFLVLICAFCFAGHLLVVARFAKRFSALYLSFVQFMVCAGLSAVAALFTETMAPGAVTAAAIPLFYG
ncbi:MAG TPA: EamA family transporter, partial [Desulfobacteraceae bacterium]|nr:EamA family transporter [Desulfobacteraceae bacterium]